MTEETYFCHGCRQEITNPIDHEWECPGLDVLEANDLLAAEDRVDDDVFTEQDIMEAEAEMEIKMVLPAAGYHCDIHSAVPAVKRLNTSDGYLLDLCVVCCENVATELMKGVHPDVGTEQMRQEWERD